MPETIYSYAKLNLYLAVLGLRDDGYHDLQTVMHEIDLRDRLELHEAAETTLSCSLPDVPIGGDNLVIKAHSLMKELDPDIPDYHIELHKSIPPGAGLAGGSSNAVALLVSLSRMRDANFDLATLENLAAQLGSDTNFFLYGNTALCSGRGEIVQPILQRRLYFNIVLPDIRCLTPRVFEVYDTLAQSPQESSENWLSAWQDGSRVAPHNDLESAAVSAYPELGEYLGMARKQNVSVHLSGSGSAFYSLHERESDRDETYRELREIYGETCKIIKSASHVRLAALANE